MKTEQNKKAIFTEFGAWVGIKDPIGSIDELKEAFQMGHLQELGRTSD